MAQIKMGSRADLKSTKIICIFAVICCTILEIKGNFNCDDHFLSSRCTNLFSGGFASGCGGAALQLFPKCLLMASECKRRQQESKYTLSSSVNYRQIYNKLIKRVKTYRRCFTRSSLACNESMIQKCYENFEQNSSKTCQDVHKLRFCILILRPTGCHEMRNPWYTLAVGIIKNYRSCFIQNYTILLEALQQKKPVPTFDLKDDMKNTTGTEIAKCYSKKKWVPNYTFYGAVLFCVVVIFLGISLLICLKRLGVPSKSRRTLVNSNQPLDFMLEPRRTCVTSGRTPLTYTIDEEDAPPPYYAETGGIFVEGIDSPPPYTSRPTSVNGDFV